MARSRYNPDLDARATNPALCPRLGASVVKRAPKGKLLRGKVVEAHPAGSIQMRGKGGKFPGRKTNVLNLIKVQYTVGAGRRTTSLVRATQWQLAG